MNRNNRNLLRALFVIIALIIIGLIAYFAEIPFLFPSLGPTTYLLFYKPLSVDASPKHAILGNFIGIIGGLIGLASFGLVGGHQAFMSNISLEYVGSCVIALTLTSAVMYALHVQHPPAGATTLIIALGIINTIPALIVTMVSITFLVGLGWVCNHLTGVKYPLWSAPKPARAPD